MVLKTPFIPFTFCFRFSRVTAQSLSRQSPSNLPAVFQVHEGCDKGHDGLELDSGMLGSLRSLHCGHLLCQWWLGLLWGLCTLWGALVRSGEAEAQASHRYPRTCSPQVSRRAQGGCNDHQSLDLTQAAAQLHTHQIWS